MVNPNPNLIEQRDGVGRAVFLFVALVLVGIVALVGVIRILTNDAAPVIHTRGGVTWQGDDCQVIEDLGVIVCRGPIG